MTLLSPTSIAALSSLHTQLNNRSHLASPSLSNPHEGQGQRPRGGSNNPETQSSHSHTEFTKPASLLMAVSAEEASWMSGETSSLVAFVSALDSDSNIWLNVSLAIFTSVRCF